MKPWDEELLRTAFEIAAAARKNGNHPFGALLADQQGKILLTAENTVVTDKDCTAHAETNLVRKACKAYASNFFGSLHTVYQHGTLPDVCRSDLLVQYQKNGLWLE